MRNNGQWTEARYHSFIVSGLRALHMKWSPKSRCIKKAWVNRGVYKCEHCKKEGAATLPPKKGNKKRVKNILADHIFPVVCPTTGFVDWNTFIDRLFVEEDGYQALCHHCHVEVKTKEEREVAKVYTRLRKDNPREHKSWINMMSRCNNPNSTGYEYYGERGIEVEGSWHDFKNFLTDMGKRPEGTSIDRIDNNGNYEKDNCRWATLTEQARNRSTNHYISYKGECKTIVEWSDDIGVKQNTLLYRIRRGWSKEEYLNKVPRKQQKVSRIDEDTWKEIAAMRLEGYGIVELGEMFDIDSSQISRKTNGMFDEDDKAILKEHVSFKMKYKTAEEREIRKRSK